MPVDTIPARLLARAAEQPERIAYQHRGPDGAWVRTDWATYAAQVREAARALIALGVEAGDHVCILGPNRPEWVLFDVAAMMIGATPAGIYTTSSSEEVVYITGHCQARVILCATPDQLDKVVWDELPQLQHAVLMAGSESSSARALTWQAFLARGAAVSDGEVDARLAALRSDDVATLIYTSGTTGRPKAVMLTHDNLVFTNDTATRLVDMGPSDRMVSYLPLSHIAEQLFTVHAGISRGYLIAYARSPDVLLEEITSVQPTILFAVPRVWEKIHAKLSARLSAATGPKAVIARWAVGVGERVIALRNEGREPSALLALQHRLAHRLFFSKVKAALGMEAVRFGISGAAPISADILRFFAGLDIMIYEVYGQSEDTGPSTINAPGKARFGTVGLPLPETEVRIADDGEVLVRGRHVFAGYLHDPEATAATLQDGWLCSGDLGSFDDEGYLSITGRKKEILITAGGKNVAPAMIESALRDLPLVSQGVLIGDRRRFISALITLDAEALEAFAATHGLPSEDLHAHPKVREAIQASIDAEVNPRFARVEQVREFRILPRDLSIDDGELTPTLKLKRRVIEQHFSEQIESMYA